MLNEVEIAREICDVTKILIEKKKTGTDDKESRIALGMLVGLITALGRFDDLEKSMESKTDNWLAFVNRLLDDIASRNNLPTVSKDLN